jgi:hypothetical protein
MEDLSCHVLSTILGWLGLTPRDSLPPLQGRRRGDLKAALPGRGSPSCPPPLITTVPPRRPLPPEHDMETDHGL